MTITEERPAPQTQTGSGEPRFAHIALRDDITDGYVFGRPVEALCGQVFVPSRDPKRYPLCPVCKNIAESEWEEGPPKE